MSDTLHKANAQMLQRLHEHAKRYESDPEYRKWFDSLSTKQYPIVVVP